VEKPSVVGGLGGFAAFYWCFADPQGVGLMHPDRFAALSRSLGDSTSRRGLLRLLGVGVAGTAITVVGLNEVEAERKKPRKAQRRKVRAEKKPGGPAAPEVKLGSVTGTIYDRATDVTSPYSGTFDISQFAVQDGGVVAIGTLTPAIPGVQEIALPVNLAQSEGTCEILELVLGPLHLDLLGLVIDLDQIVLEITAERGSGNLLGNLLCAIAGLLDDIDLGGLLENLLQDLVDLLNQLLGQLNL
jgi:hypothetical protein